MRYRAAQRSQALFKVHSRTRPCGDLGIERRPHGRSGVTAGGSWVTLKGTGLADAPFAASMPPYPKTLLGTQVFMQNQPVTLALREPRSVNALVPAGMTPECSR